MQELRKDVVIVGGGLAGMVAANRLAEFGISPLVIEKGESEKYLCNSRISGGALHLCMGDVTSSSQDIEQRILDVTEGHAHPALAKAAAKHGARAVEWLRSQGAQFVRIPSSQQNHVMAPPRPSQPGLIWEGRGPDVMLRRLEQSLLARGGRLMRGIEAQSLKMVAGRCVGLIARQKEELVSIDADAVIFADGGYQGDAEMLRRYVTPAPDKVKLRNAGTGVGSGIRMAEAAGAALAGMEFGFYGHLLALQAMDNEKLWPFPVMDYLASAGIVVGPDAKRFADEGRGGILMANAVSRLADPSSSIVIFDSGIWEGPGKHRAIPPNPHLLSAGGEVIEAPTVHELAAKLCIPADTLTETVSAHNAAVSDGNMGQLIPSRSNAGEVKAHPIVVAPFLAVRLCAGVTYTMGGVAHDEHGRVLDRDSHPISGLFAAGATTGGLEGGPNNGYVGGLSKATIFGLRTAEFIAGRVQN